jgi:hypothetical protein
MIMGIAVDSFLGYEGGMMMKKLITADICTHNDAFRFVCRGKPVFDGK